VRPQQRWLAVLALAAVPAVVSVTAGTGAAAAESSEVEQFYSTFDQPLVGPIVAQVTTPSGGGYYLLGADGGVFTFGDAVFAGSLHDLGVETDAARAVVSAPDGRGYWIGLDDGRWFGFGTSAGHERPHRFAWPVPGPVESGFGNRRHPVYGGTRLHTGLDIDAAHGDPAAAAAAGTVSHAGWKTGYGKSVVIAHDQHTATLYAHLSAIGVGVGDAVAAGQQIGQVGETGVATGPHLHFEVRIDDEPVDPRDHLASRS
jgi:murein DD-endopeptidase MepM/ murein hydrolase activator NlpD